MDTELQSMVDAAQSLVARADACEDQALADGQPGAEFDLLRLLAGYSPSGLSLTFYTFEEKMPAHEQVIFMVGDKWPYHLRAQLVTAQYHYTQYDAKGDPTGITIGYDPEDPEPPEGCKRELCLDGEVRGVVWCPADAFNDLIEGARARQKAQGAR